MKSLGDIMHVHTVFRRVIGLLYTMSTLYRYSTLNSRFIAIRCVSGEALSLELYSPFISGLCTIIRGVILL